MFNLHGRYLLPAFFFLIIIDLIIIVYFCECLAEIASGFLFNNKDYDYRSRNFLFLTTLWIWCSLGKEI